MAVNTLLFSAQIDAWVKQTEARMLAVFRESSKRVTANAQRRCPVDTGYLRASMQVSLQSMPQIDPGSHGSKDQRYSDATPVAILAIGGAQLGQTIHVGWTANYADIIENGHSQQAPNGFVRVSALEWPRIVDDVTADAKARANA